MLRACLGRSARGGCSHGLLSLTLNISSAVVPINCMGRIQDWTQKQASKIINDTIKVNDALTRGIDICLLIILDVKLASFSIGIDRAWFGLEFGFEAITFRNKEEA